MSEIPSPDSIKKVSVSDHIGFLKQFDAVKGAISNEFDNYDDILARWNAKIITDEQAIAEADAISAGRQENYH